MGQGLKWRWRRRASTVIGLGIATVAAVAVPTLAHPSFPATGPVFANPNGGTGAGTQTPPYAPGSTNTLNLRVPFERDGVIFNGALNTTVEIKATVRTAGPTRSAIQRKPRSAARRWDTAVPGWTCAIETAGDGHQMVHWSGPQVDPTQTAADSAQFFTFKVNRALPDRSDQLRCQRWARGVLRGPAVRRPQ